MAKKYLARLNGDIVEIEVLITSAGAADVGKLIGLDANGEIPASMLPSSVIGTEQKILAASEALAAGDFVNIWDDAGATKARLADASAGMSKKADGYVLAAVILGANATVYLDGTNTQSAGLTGGTDYYLSNTTPGKLMAAPPTTATHIIQIVGKALSATEISFKSDRPITI